MLMYVAATMLETRNRGRDRELGIEFNFISF